MDSPDEESRQHNPRDPPPPPPPPPPRNSLCLWHHPPPHHHHHHHHHFSYISPYCPHHSHLLQQINHSQSCPLFTGDSSPQYTEPPYASIPSQAHRNLQVSHSIETLNYSPMTQDETEKLEPEEEEEDEPIFVLTDEWKEFFAKSEAKRRLAKKDARKKGKT